jgi:hypothetical protein
MALSEEKKRKPPTIGDVNELLKKAQDLKQRMDEIRGHL